MLSPGSGLRHRARPKTVPVDAHSVAVAGLRSHGLRPVMADDIMVVVRLLVDRRAHAMVSDRVYAPGDTAVT